MQQEFHPTHGVAWIRIYGFSCAPGCAFPASMKHFAGADMSQADHDPLAARRYLLLRHLGMKSKMFLIIAAPLMLMIGIGSVATYHLKSLSP